MSRELWLLRHGHAEQSGYDNDKNRRLTVQGVQEAQFVGQWLKEMDLYPDAILVSPATRALTTAQHVIEALAWAGILRQDPRLYFHGKEAIKTLLAEIAGQRVLIVGHNPDFEKLLIGLVGSENLPHTNGLMPTAALARLQMPDAWNSLPYACASLLAMRFAPSPNAS